ncbi:MAG: amidase [Acidobacteriia bacterium]|nr:amidase [Terriglobia bacterium]
MDITRRGFAAGAIAAVAASAAGSDQLTDLSIAEASARIRQRSVTSTQLTEACLARIEKYNPRVNAFITVMSDRALAQARDLDAEQRAGKFRGPLHGIPIGLKDLIDTEGVRTTAASAVFADRIPKEDAEVVRKLKAAGAVLIGKLNMHEFAYGATSVPSHFGPVHNPWKLDHIAGGSSGGSAAAVAARLCFGALGSDTGGSVRQPSSYCALAGLKPTYGRVSTRGVVPLSWSLDHIGPMCRTVADAAILLGGIAGYDPLETTSIDAPVPAYTQAMRIKTSSLRLGIPRTVFYEKLDPEIEAAANAAIEVLRKLTSGARDVELPAIGNLPVLGAEAYSYHLPYFSKTPELYQPMTRDRLERNAHVTADAYIRGRRDLDRLRREVTAVFSSVDLLITPTTPVPPSPIEGSGSDITAGGASSSLRNTSPFDVYGLPTISVPCGFTASGLPIGIQISGPNFAEARVLALAHAFEQATTWHTRRPPEF